MRQEMTQAMPREGRLAKAIEEQTSKLPSDTFLWAALGTMIGAIALNATGQKSASTLVAQWTPVLLIMGLYNKLVKLGGHDQIDRI